MKKKVRAVQAKVNALNDHAEGLVGIMRKWQRHLAERKARGEDNEDEGPASEGDESSDDDKDDDDTLTLKLMMALCVLFSSSFLCASRVLCVILCTQSRVSSLVEGGAKDDLVEWTDP